MNKQSVGKNILLNIVYVGLSIMKLKISRNYSKMISIQKVVPKYFWSIVFNSFTLVIRVIMAQLVSSGPKTQRFRLGSATPYQIPPIPNYLAILQILNDLYHLFFTKTTNIYFNSFGIWSLNIVHITIIHQGIISVVLIQSRK